MRRIFPFVGMVFLLSSIALAKDPAENSNPKLASVKKIFVEPIEGNSGALTRNKLMALLANSERFEVVEDLKLADAVMKGWAEEQEIGVTVPMDQNATQGAGGFAAGVSEGLARSEYGRTAKRIMKTTLLIRLTLPTGEIIWAWDDTKKCKRDSKSQCAVEDLLEKAK